MDTGEIKPYHPDIPALSPSYEKKVSTFKGEEGEANKAITEKALETLSNSSTVSEPSTPRPSHTYSNLKPAEDSVGEDHFFFNPQDSDLEYSVSNQNPHQIDQRRHSLSKTQEEDANIFAQPLPHIDEPSTEPTTLENKVWGNNPHSEVIMTLNDEIPLRGETKPPFIPPTDAERADIPEFWEVYDESQVYDESEDEPSIPEEETHSEPRNSLSLSEEDHFQMDMEFDVKPEPESDISQFSEPPSPSLSRPRVREESISENELNKPTQGFSDKAPPPLTIHSPTNKEISGNQ